MLPGLTLPEHMEWTSIVTMSLGMMAALVVIVLIVRTVVRRNVQHDMLAAFPSQETARQILDRRLASGELAPEEYASRRRVLRS